MKFGKVEDPPAIDFSVPADDPAAGEMLMDTANILLQG